MPMIENGEDVKKYIILSSYNNLSNLKSFKRAYGNFFIKHSLFKNIQKTYTDTENISYKGHYDPKEKSITISKFFKDNQEPITVDDIQNSREMQEDIFHEAVHACLNNNKEQKDGLMGYGDNEKYGKGINEGFINWICQKGGMYSGKSYYLLTNIVNELEIATDENKVMVLPKKNFKDGVANELSLSAEDTGKIYDLCDELYKNELSRNIYKKINTTLDKCYEKLDNDVTNKEEIDSEFEKIKNIKELSELQLDNRYAEFKKEYLDAFPDAEHRDVLQGYMRYSENCLKNEITKDKIEIDVLLYENYFEKILDDAKQNGAIAKSQMKSLAKFYELVKDIPEEMTLPKWLLDIDEYEIKKVDEFRKKFVDIGKAYVNSKLGKVEDDSDELVFDILSTDTNETAIIIAEKENIFTKLLNSIKSSFNSKKKEEFIMLDYNYKQDTREKFISEISVVGNSNQGGGKSSNHYNAEQIEELNQ